MTELNKHKAALYWIFYTEYERYRDQMRALDAKEPNKDRRRTWFLKGYHEYVMSKGGLKLIC